MSFQQSSFLSTFACTGAACEDTCCKGWGMQVDVGTRELYKKEAPELLDAVTSGEAQYIMRRDKETGYCVKFRDGLCGVHAEKGERFLGDACHFYPRILRKFGEKTVMTAALSCPEVTRLALFAKQEETPFSLEENHVDRLPYKMADYLPPDIGLEEAEAIMQAFVAEAGEEGATAEQHLLRIATVARSLERLEPKSWKGAVPFLLRTADQRLLPAEAKVEDPHKIFHALCGLIGTTAGAKRTRLMTIIGQMERALKLQFEWDSLSLFAEAGALSSYQELKVRWEEKASQEMEPVLRRFLQAQLAMASFPFAGFGRNLVERITIIGVRFATVRLALLCHMEGDKAPDQTASIRVIQGLSRFMDHLVDPELSVQIYTELGWMQEGRLRGMLESILT